MFAATSSFSLSLVSLHVTKLTTFSINLVKSTLDSLTRFSVSEGLRVDFVTKFSRSVTSLATVRLTKLRTNYLNFSAAA